MNQSHCLILCLLLLCAQQINAQQIEIQHYKYFQDIRVNTIEIDQYDRKWLGTSDGVYSLSSFTNLPTLEYPIGAYSITCDLKNKMWLGLENNVLFNITDTLNFLFSKETRDILNNIVVLPGQVVIGTTNKVLSFQYGNKSYSSNYLYTSADLVTKTYDKKNGGFNRVNWLFVHQNENLFIGTDTGLFKVNRKGKIGPFSKPMQVSAFTYFGGSLWLAGIDGVWEYKEMKKWVPHPEYFTGTPYRISAMAFDKKGALWLLSNRLTMCANGDCTEFSEDQGFTSKHGLCLKVDKENNIWIGTEGKGLFRAKYKEKEEDEKETKVETIEIVEIPEPDVEKPVESEPATEIKETQATPVVKELTKEEVDLKNRYDYMRGFDYANIVLLIDVSSSMAQEEKYPRLNESVKAVLRRMRPEDRVSIITFSQWPTVVLEPTSCTNNEEIETLLDSLIIKGVSNVDRGLIHAADYMSNVMIPNGNNRIVLATDGMFDVDKETFDAIKECRKRGIALSVFDFGRSNNTQLEKLADKGGGNYQLIPKTTTNLISILEGQIKASNK